MKNLLTRCFLIGLVAVFCGLVSGCEEPKKPFDLTVSSFGPDYIEVKVTAATPVEMSYVVTTTNQNMSNPAVLYATGTKLNVTDGQIVRITEEIVQDTEYFIYAVAKLDAQNFSAIDVETVKTQKYNFDEIITVLDTYYDGFKLHITVPQEVKKAKNALRYTSASLAVYNKIRNLYGETYAGMLITNGGAHTRFIKNDSTMVYTDENIYELDEDGNVIIYEMTGEPIDFHDPIVPGEPVVYLVGEFGWGDVKETMGFSFGGVDPDTGFDNDKGYFDPKCTRGTDDWHGAFHKKEFMVDAPTVLDADVKVEISDVSPIDAIVSIIPDEAVHQYVYSVVDASTYNALLSLLDEREELVQWYLTSYIAYLELGVQVESGPIQFNAMSGFTEPLQADAKYYVLITAMGDEDGTSQRFFKTEFRTAAKTKAAPVIEVTPCAVDRNRPYEALFNVKAPNGDLAAAYWACNYRREWQMYLNQKFTYEDICNGNYSFTSDEIAKINSPEGYTMSFPTLDGETSRLVVYGCNDEYTFNVISETDVNEPAVADYTAPYAQAIAPVSSPLFAALPGEWTATATLHATEYVNENPVKYNLTHSSKIVISNTAPEIPETLPNYVYDLYNSGSTPISRDEVDDMFAELKSLSETFTVNRIENHNRLLCTGFLDFDYYEDPGRLDTRTPYDLFVSETYSSVDVPQLINDFGPKWFFQVANDGSVYIPLNQEYLPPMHNWPGYPFYVAAYCEENNLAFATANEAVRGFPVEISADKNTITIKPIVLEGEDGKQYTYYMNAMGVSASGTELVAPVISDIVLTRGWTDTKASASVPATVSVSPRKVDAVEMDGTPAVFKAEPAYKSMTKLVAPEKIEFKKVDKPNAFTLEEFDAAMERSVEKYLNGRR